MGTGRREPWTADDERGSDGLFWAQLVELGLGLVAQRPDRDVEAAAPRVILGKMVSMLQREVGQTKLPDARPGGGDWWTTSVPGRLWAHFDGSVVQLDKGRHGGPSGDRLPTLAYE